MSNEQITAFTHNRSLLASEAGHPVSSPKRGLASLARQLAVLVWLGLLAALPDIARAQNEKSTTGSLNELGAEGEFLMHRVGSWDVIETAWDAPGAAPVTTSGLVAERFLMGTLLQEVICKPGELKGESVQRTDFLSYNRLQGRWGYVSFDTRAPIGLMPAWSRGRGDDKTITLAFDPFAVPSAAAVTVGQFILMEQDIRWEKPDSDVKDQYFTLADGTGARWLAHRYFYTRRGPLQQAPAFTCSQGKP